MEVGLMKGRNDSTAAYFPGFQVSRDEALAHDGLEDLSQNPLRELLRRLSQHELGHRGV